MQMRKFGVKFQKIDLILISHLHGDHYFGLIGLMSTMHLLGRTKSLKIVAPKGLSALITLQLKTSYAVLGFNYEIQELESDYSGCIYEDDKISIETFPLRHKIPTHGYSIVRKEKERKLIADKVDKERVKIEYYHRLKKGEDIIEDNGRLIKSDDFTMPGDPAKKYSFCSDTEYFEKIIPFIKQADLLYHEATFLEELRDRAKETKHSTAREAALIAAKSEVKKLLLGHLSARYDDGVEHVKEAGPIFGNVEVVEDGMTYSV